MEKISSARSPLSAGSTTSNMVRLVGFCLEEMRRVVYEYMPHGSLDKYIFSAEKSFWALPGGSTTCIRGVTCRFYTGESFVPLNAMRGTFGYIAPEMISRSFGVISSKSDVYNFGMLLLEMAGGRRNADPNAATSSQGYYPSVVYDQLTQRGEAGEISPVAADMHELEKKLCVVGLWCIQMRSRDQPSMSEVMEMLETRAEGLQTPSRPFFCDEEHIHVENSYHFTSLLTVVSEEEE